MEMYQHYRWIVCGCLFITEVDKGEIILSRLNEIFVETTKMGYGHGEEMFFLEVLDEFYDDIERSYGDYQHILNNFIQPTIGYDYIYNHIIKNYLQFSYHREGYDCCKKLILQIESYNVSIDNELYMNILFSFFVFTFYHKGKEEAKALVEYIKQIITENPLIRREYIKQQPFYDTQFAHAY
jgi:hypothetical protein